MALDDTMVAGALEAAAGAWFLVDQKRVEYTARENQVGLSTHRDNFLTVASAAFDRAHKMLTEAD